MVLAGRGIAVGAGVSIPLASDTSTYGIHGTVTANRPASGTATARRGAIATATARKARSTATVL